MPDIAMCTGGDCPLRDKCYRFLATPNSYLQSYIAVTPYVKVNGVVECKYFWKHDRERSSRTPDEPSSEDFSGETAVV